MRTTALLAIATVLAGVMGLTTAAPNVGVSGRCYVPDRDYPDEAGNPYSFSCSGGTFCCYGALYDEQGLILDYMTRCCTNSLCCHSHLVQGNGTAYMSTWCEQCPSDPGGLTPPEPGDPL